MNTRILMTMVAVALVLTSCSNDEDEINNGPVELRMTSGVLVQTRASGLQGTQIMNGETVYAWVEEATFPSPTAYINAWELTASGTDGALSGSTRYFPESGNSVNIYALHGNFGTGTFTEGTTGFPAAVVHTVSNNQSENEDYAKSDLLYAAHRNIDRSGASGNVKTQELTFYHMLSKIEVALIPGEGNPDLTTAVVTIENTRPAAVFMPDKSQDISVQADRASMITLAPEDNNSPTPITIKTPPVTTDLENPNYEDAIIVPQTVGAEGATNFIKVKLQDGGELYYKVDNETFGSGKKYSYKITVNLTELNVKATIHDWESVDAVDGDATMD